MSATRANVEAAKAFFYARIGDGYVFGGEFDQDVEDGTDCSGLWNDELGLVVGRFQWGREAEGATTESYRYIPIGGVGPFGTIRVASPNDIPADAIVKLAFHHEGSGGAASHMWGELDGVRMEAASNPKGVCTAPEAWEITNPYANAWAYLPGPIIEDGSTVTAPPEPKDTLFADVSEFQTVVDDSYPYSVLSIRTSDGTYRDHNFAANYAWMRAALDSGRLTMGIVYFYWRPNWQDAIATHQDMVNAGGGPHPRIVSMIDVERGGNPAGDFSDALNATDDALSAWLGDPRRVIAYGNTGDLNGMWSNRREDQFIVAGYGSNPTFPGKIAHQYTDGNGYGGGLPEGCSPFGNCDMNSADGLTATALAAACGINSTAPPSPPPPSQPPPTPGGSQMADANGILALLNGDEAAAGGDPWRLVTLLEDYTGPDQVEKDPDTPTKAPWLSPSIFDHGSVVAKIVTRRYVNKHGQRLDIFDILVGLYQASGEPEVVKGPVTS